ncbi:MAG: glycosyltransferase family 2 protein [SAR324 cluster bacterium]|nr:glycosyltransferase family 2 protein [SAR324 cluster bacterium]
MPQLKSFNLIPLAGAGKRFSDVGYTLPKPLISISGRPMIIQACRSLPDARQWIFVCREEHCLQYPLAETLQEFYPGSHLIKINYLTEGQASTCYLAAELLDDEQPLLIGPCDNGMTWNRTRYENLISDTNVDAIIWTFRNNATVNRNPQMYGWVRLNDNGLACDVSCKTPVSTTPVQDHAVVGTFYFKKAGFFKKAYLSMVQKNRRINNEFYVDVLMNELIEDGLNVHVFEIDQYICWGTPNDLKTYEYWENYFTLS